MQVVAKVPVAGPVPPPSMVVTPELSASSICCGQMKWMWLSMPPAVRIMPSPAMTSVPAPMTRSRPAGCRVAGLADAGDAAVLMPTSAFTMPQWSTISALVMVSAAVGGDALVWPMPSRITLPPPNFTSSP